MALHRPLARLFHRTVPASAVRGFGGALVVAGVALPWVVAVAAGWAAAEVAPVLQTQLADAAKIAANLGTETLARFPTFAAALPN